MPLEELKAAVIRSDGDAVVDELSSWAEAERKKAVAPINELIGRISSVNVVGLRVLGQLRDELESPASPIDFDEFRESLPQRIKGLANDPWPAEKFELALAIAGHFFEDFESGLSIDDAMRQLGERNMDLRNTQELANLGVGGLKQVRDSGFNLLIRDWDRASRLLIERRPKWLGQWIQRGYRKNVEGIPLPTWLALFHLGLAEWDDDNEMQAVHFAGELPGLDRQATDELTAAVPATRELIYRVPQLDLFSIYDSWAPIVQDRNEAGDLDHVRFFRAVVSGLQMGFKRNHQQDSINLALLVDGTPEEWAQVQADLIGLLDHSIPVVVGFALDTLDELETAGLLDRQSTLSALPAVFSMKPKSHPLVALSLIKRIAADESLRSSAIIAAVHGFSHPHTDVQEWVVRLLETQLRPTDTQIIEQLAQHESTVAASLKPRLQKLLSGLGGARVTIAADPAAAQPLKLDLDAFAQRLEQFPQRIRELLHLEQAITAARDLRMDVRCDWSMMSGRVLAGVEPIQPIESFQELIDTVNVAVEQLESPDEYERILDALARFAGDRPDNFENQTAALRKQVFQFVGDRSRQGLLFGQYGDSIALLIGAWLVGAESEDQEEREHIQVWLTLLRAAPDCIGQLIDHVVQRMFAREPCQLLSTPTHTGGWIDPRIWVTRLKQRLESGPPIHNVDFAKSVIRLAPDHRSDLLAEVDLIAQPYRDLAACALGGDIDLKTATGDPVLWVAACRARDVNGSFPELIELISGANGPDLIHPYTYRWQDVGASIVDSVGNLTFGLQSAREVLVRLGDMAAAMKEPDSGDSHADDAAATTDWFNPVVKQRVGFGHPTTEVHGLPVWQNASWFFPWMATHWPAKLDWYWLKAARQIASRLESNPSVFEQFGRFLLPLFERDRPLTPMASRALWIATVSKDANARTPAIDVWIELISDGRADLQLLSSALWEISSAGLVKNNRIATAFSEIAPVSPLHTWTAGHVVENYLAVQEKLPRDAHVLLGPLNDWFTGLGLAVSRRLRERLNKVRSGKTKQLAKQLLELSDAPTADRREAVHQSVSIRFDRAIRFSE